MGTTPAVRCEDIHGRGSWLLPADLVWVPDFSNQGSPSAYERSTTGLASGNTLEEATLHGLLEVLERDSIAMNRACDESLRVEDDSLPAPFREWAKMWRRLSVNLMVRFVPNEFGLPCFDAVLHDTGSVDVNLSGGSGLHLDRRIALARAVCEAAQSRLGLIHGGRDDVTTFFEKYQPHREATTRRADEAVVARLMDGPVVDFRSTPSVRCTSIPLALTVVLRRLSATGFVYPMRHRMSPARLGRAADGFHVVKIVVPRCETSSLPDRPCVGPRLWARISGRPRPARH